MSDVGEEEAEKSRIRVVKSITAEGNV